jgi:hypothetical protein
MMFVSLAATQWMLLLEQELLTLPKHLNPPPVISGICVSQSLVFCIVYCEPLSIFHLSSFGLIRFTASGDILGIFKLFL